MSILTRARRAIRQFMIGRAPVIVKNAPYIFNYAKDKPAWTQGNYLSYVAEGYQSNPLIYQAIIYKVRAAAATRLRAYSGDETSQKLAPQTHPLAVLLARPNEHQSWTEFEGLNIAFLNISGNAYIYLDRGKSGTGPITAMYPMRPDRVRIIPGDNGIKAFVYIPKGQTAESGFPIMPDQMMHVKMPNPADEFEGMGYGMSPMMPLAQSIDVDNGFTSFIKVLTENGLMPAGLLKFDTDLDQADVDEQRRRFVDRYGGVDNWGDVVILDKGGDYKQIGMNFKDLDFSTIDKRNETRSLGVLGVPVILLETVAGLSSATYSNKAAARTAFWEDVMTFELGIFDDEYKHFLNQPNIFVQRDYSNVPALQKNIPELVKAARILWTMGAPANQAIRTVGIKMDDIPGGDESYINGKAQGDNSEDQQLLDAAARLAAGNQNQDNPADQPTDTQTQEDVQKRLHLPVQVKAMGADDYCVLAMLPNHPTVQMVQDTLKGVLPEANWQKPGTLHLTLAFATGSRDQVDRVVLDGGLQALVIERVDQFETADGYVIHLGIRRTQDLITYQARLVEQMSLAGMAVDAFSLDWKPHITLATATQPITPFSITPIIISAQDVSVTDSAYQSLRTAALKSSGLRRSEAKAWDQQKKSLIWKAIDDIATSHEEAFGDAAVKAFKKDKRAMLALVQKAKEKSIQRKATIDWLALADDVTTYFKSSETTWRNTFLPVMGGLVEDTGNYWSVELGMAFDVRNVLGEVWFQNYTLTFAQPISQTSSDTIHDILGLAQAEGWSLFDMTERLGLTFDQWMNGDVPPGDLAWLKNRTLPYRREMIARTEITRIQGAGAQALFTDWGIKKKEWLATQDSRCRPSHKAADGQQRDMDKTFSVGGFQMMHPGDMSNGAPVSEIVFCRCAELPIVEDA